MQGGGTAAARRGLPRSAPDRCRQYGGDLARWQNGRLQHRPDRISQAFEEQLGADAVGGKTAMLVGAGGAGRAVAFALIDLGAARYWFTISAPRHPKRWLKPCARFAGHNRAATVTLMSKPLSPSRQVSLMQRPWGCSAFPAVPLPHGRHNRRSLGRGRDLHATRDRML